MEDQTPSPNSLPSVGTLNLSSEHEKTVAHYREKLTAKGIEHAHLDSRGVEMLVNHLREEYQRNMEVARRLALCDCPARHIENLAGVDPNNLHWNETRDTLFFRLSGGYLVALLGKRGTGKTLLAVSVMQLAVMSRRSARYLKAGDFFRRIRATYTPGAKESEQSIFKLYSHVDLLVLDEMHQRSESQFQQDAIIGLIDARYDAKRATILISNQTPDAFAQSVGDSIVSRMHEIGDVFEFKGKSYRIPGSWDRQNDAGLEEVA